MNRYVLAALLVATAMTAGAVLPAAAQTAPPAPTRDAPPEPRGGGMRSGGLMRADSNNDGVVTREEVIADADRRFAEMDRDRDGTISHDERRTAREARCGPPPVGVEGAPPPPPPGATDAPPPPSPDARRGERERALRMFDRADSNGDGRVDRQEVEAMRLLMRARMADAARRDAPPREMRPGDEQP